MSHGGMSPRGGLSDVSAGAETLREGEPAPFAGAHDLAEAPVRVTLAETREQLLRSFLRERSSGGPAPSSVDALLDSMEAARRGTSVTLVRPHERAPARASDDAFSFGRVIRSGSARHRGAGSNSNDVDVVDGSPNVDDRGDVPFGVDSIDTRAAARWLEHTVPVVVILLVSFLLARAASLAAFAWTTAAFLKANDCVKRGVSIGVLFDRPICATDEEEANGDGASRLRSSTRETSPAAAGDAVGNARLVVDAEPFASQTERRANLSRDLSRDLSDGKDDLRERSAREKRRFVCLLAALALSGGAVGVLAATFPGESFWDAFFFRALARAETRSEEARRNDDDHESFSFLDHLWRAAMADLIARLATVCVKACVLMLGDRRWKTRQKKTAKKVSNLLRDEDENGARSAAASRARLARAARLRRRAESYRLAFVEHVSLTARTAMPVGTWFAYFMRGAYETRRVSARDPNGVFLFAPPSDVSRLGACLAAGAYCAVKVKAFLERFVALRVVTVGVLEAATRDPTGLGAGARESVSAEISNAGNECTVCCDAFEFPVTLSCGHVFCEKCVGVWFERSRACPLCRAVVAGKHCGVVEHGDGATVAWPYAF